MKTHFSSILLLAICSLFLVISTSCSNDDDSDDNAKRPVQINGVVEKGPFVEGSAVSIFELDKNLNETGKIFKSETNKEGHFSISASEKLMSDIVYVSVTGYYFNEVTGNLSAGTITLDALAYANSNGQEATINVNILTHLELPRVLRLVKEEGKTFDQAKKQAQKELLAAFLITDQNVTPEATAIEENSTQANILIAISSIILNQSNFDAEITAFMSNLRNDLLDGTVTPEMAEKIKEASYKLNYKTVKKNVKTYYTDKLGKNINIGEFQCFIDGDGDGQIGNDYYVPEEITTEDIFQTEEMVQMVMASALMNACIYEKSRYLFDALYTNTIANPNFGYDINDMYNHRLTSANGYIHSFWNKAYESNCRHNTIIKGITNIKKPEFDKYKYMALTLRAQQYLSMTQLWGDVPLVTEDMGNEEIIIKPRTPQAEVLKQIINDLTIAEQNLPETGNEYIGSKYYASALLARTYLFMKDYNKALQYAQKVIGSNKYSLSANYNDIFTKNNTEAIYTIPFTTTYSNNDFLTELIKKGDYLPLARLAEVILTASEANLQLGNSQQSIDLLNQVRTRNNHPAIAPGASKEQVQQALLQEWDKDMTKEGHWFFTLKRFGNAEQVLNIQSYMNLLPIPRREMDFNSAITQNPGYY